MVPNVGSLRKKRNVRYTRPKWECFVGSRVSVHVLCIVLVPLCSGILRCKWGHPVTVLTTLYDVDFYRFFVAIIERVRSRLESSSLTKKSSQVSKDETGRRHKNGTCPDFTNSSEGQSNLESWRKLTVTIKK